MQPTALDATKLEKLIAAAVAAPSIHNSQPWRYRLDPDTATLEIRVASPGLRHTDPAGSALYLSVGASLFNLRIAVEHFGWLPVVRLLPRPGRPELLATVKIAGPSRDSAGDGHELYDAVWRRHTSRMPFHARRPDPRVLKGLEEAALGEGASLRVAAPQETRRLLRITAEAERRNTRDPERRAESRRWVLGPGGGGGGAGIPGSALGPQDSTGRIPMRDFSGLRHQEPLPSAVFENNPTVAVLSTPHDRRIDWLRAGQALEHILLLATAGGLRASMLHQAVEWPDLRWALRDPDEAQERSGHAHMLLRLGYGPQGAATPRRAVRTVLEGGVTAGDDGPPTRHKV